MKTPSNSPRKSFDNSVWVEVAPESVLSISESVEDNSVSSSSLFDYESVSSEVSCPLCLPKRNRKTRLVTTASDRFAGHGKHMKRKKGKRAMVKIPTGLSLTLSRARGSPLTSKIVWR